MLASGGSWLANSLRQDSKVMDIKLFQIEKNEGNKAQVRLEEVDEELSPVRSVRKMAV